MSEESVMRMEHISRANLQMVSYQAELAGMIAENELRASKGETQAYSEDSFLILKNAIDETIRTAYY